MKKTDPQSNLSRKIDKTWFSKWSAGVLSRWTFYHEDVLSLPRLRLFFRTAIDFLSGPTCLKGFVRRRFVKNGLDDLSGLGNTWALIGHYLLFRYYLGTTRARLGQYIDTTWTLLGHYLGNTWALFGQYFGSTWALLGHTWALLGQYFGTTWVLLWHYLGYTLALTLTKYQKLS